MKYLLSLVVFFLFALPAHAATLVLSPEGEEAGVGKTMVISVRFLSEGAYYNAVEGMVNIPEGVVIDSIDTAGSALLLFPEPPRHVIADGAIEFMGGTPGTLPQDALLFTIRAHARNAGSYEFSTNTITAYRADGEGSATPAAKSPAVIAVREGADGQKAPAYGAGASLTVSYGQDPSVFDGRYFIAFYGGDSGKGVEHYEVREGWWRSVELADTSYVLKDQDLRTTLWVSAVASDGTRQTKLVLPMRTDYVSLGALLALLVAVVAVVFIARRRRV